MKCPVVKRYLLRLENPERPCQAVRDHLIRCAACHAVDKKIVGPAYQDVAAKYKDDKDASAKLAQKVKTGGSGVWGQVPMPPNAAVPDEDVKALVGWILTLKK